MEDNYCETVDHNTTKAKYSPTLKLNVLSWLIIIIMIIIIIIIIIIITLFVNQSTFIAYLLPVSPIIGDTVTIKAKIITVNINYILRYQKYQILFYSNTTSKSCKGNSQVHIHY